MSKAQVVLVFAGLLALILVALGRRESRRRKITIERESAWPGFVDSIASGVQSGLTLHESLMQAASNPARALTQPAHSFLQALESGSLITAVDKLAGDIGSPSADELAVLVRVNTKLGGVGLAKLLTEHSKRARARNALAAQLRTKVTATLAMAKLAVVAPWVLVALLIGRRETAQGYETPQGLAILLFGLGICVLAYRIVGLLGSIPKMARIYAVS